MTDKDTKRTPIKVLNLYAGIGGNRKLWDNVEVTAVEINPKIAAIYQKFFPNDKVVVADAHQYLLDHFNEFDFIWSSPPCPTHSRFRFLKNAIPECQKKYPDMGLYQEIIFLENVFNGKYCVENVISYYEPLIYPQKSGNHYFWANFVIPVLKMRDRKIRRQKGIRNDIFDVSSFKIPIEMMKNITNNCVEPKLGLHIFNLAFKEKQKGVNDYAKSG
jgi:DNA (cytosine-5)-methyltransferase 1